MPRLSGLKALVTGSTSGVGRAIAIRYANEGASVVVHGIDDPAGEDVVRTIHNSVRRINKAHYLRADLADPVACERLVKSAVKWLGGLDILINNAAIVPRGGIESADAKLFDSVMAVNLRAPMLLIKAAFPALKASTNASVVNIGSVNAYCGEAALLVYSMSKGGLMTMTRNLADALGPDLIRVNQFNLGWVLTEREQIDQEKQGHPPDWAAHVPKEFAPSGRLLSPEDIANYAVAFTEPGGFITGSVLELQQYPVIGHNPPKTPGSR